MSISERRVGPTTVYLACLTAGAALIVVAAGLDWFALLPHVGFPARELANPWVQRDLNVVRGTGTVLGLLLMLGSIALWRFPGAVAGIIARLRAVVFDVRHPLVVPVLLLAVVLAQTVLQLVLYFLGYYAFSADDFGRPLSAAHWLSHPTLDLGMDGWLGLAGSGWLSFSDYLVGAALAVHPDLFVTPRILNLILSSLATISVYFLGRELFGRACGLLTAFLFAFQPWIVWLGISGLSAELPSLVLIPLFATYLVRWVRTGRDSALLASAGFLAIANGFRYETWLLAAVASVAIVALSVRRWMRGPITRRGVLATLAALTMINAFPVVWMTASYVVYGDWLPAMHGINAFMVAFLAPGAPRTETQMNMTLLAAGAFPFEILLSVAAVAFFRASFRPMPVRLHAALFAATAVLFSLLFRGQLAAWLVAARYMLGLLVLMVPCAGLLLARLFRTSGPWRNEGVAAAAVILVTVSTFDVARALNYPSGFPRDALLAGFTIRHLQETGTLPPDRRILLERNQDFGDLSIVALANGPERFVVLNELAYRKMALSGLLANKPATLTTDDTEGVRGTVCADDFAQEACKESILRERFDLVILSSPKRVDSFMETFGCRWWSIGRYYVFDLRSSADQKLTAAPRPELAARHVNGHP